MFSQLLQGNYKDSLGFFFKPSSSLVRVFPGYIFVLRRAPEITLITRQIKDTADWMGSDLITKFDSAVFRALEIFPAYWEIWHQYFRFIYIEREFEFEYEFIFILQRLQIRQDASFHLAVNTEL